MDATLGWDYWLSGWSYGLPLEVLLVLFGAPVATLFGLAQSRPEVAAMLRGQWAVRAARLCLWAIAVSAWFSLWVLLVKLAYNIPPLVSAMNADPTVKIAVGVTALALATVLSVAAILYIVFGTRKQRREEREENERNKPNGDHWHSSAV